jgi:hypothetical protein
MNRYTFVIHIHADGLSTLENLSTHERVRVSELEAVGGQIERWLTALTGSDVSTAENAADGTESSLGRD